MKCLYCILFVVCISCSSQKRQMAADIVQEWNGKVLRFPENLELVNYAGDSLIKYEFRYSRYAIVNYVDSMGCVSCKLSLKKWVDLISVLDSLDVPCLFVFNPKKGEENQLKRYLKHAQFSYPVFIDEADSFNLLNRFPIEDKFQTFLINSENKVTAIGNPIHNPQIKNMFLSIIRDNQVKHERDNKLEVTKVNVDKEKFEFGNFDWTKEQNVTFTLKNMGDNPLVIENINTSCGCTSVNYSKEPIRPGKEVVLEVVYKADHPEYFNKTITVYCNAESSPIRLTVKGNAE